MAVVLSLASILPFLSVLANSSIVWSQPIVQDWAPRLGITDSSQLLVPITLLFVLAAFCSGLIRLFNLWLNGRLAASIGSDLSCDAVLKVLNQPYFKHLASNTSELIT